MTHRILLVLFLFYLSGLSGFILDLFYNFKGFLELRVEDLDAIVLFCLGRVFLALEWTLSTFEFSAVFFVLLNFFVGVLLFAARIGVSAVEDDLAEEVVNMSIFPLELI